jgi:hypothetical protein
MSLKERVCMALAIYKGAKLSPKKLWLHMKTKSIRFKSLVVKPLKYLEHTEADRKRFKESQRTIEWALRKGMRICWIDEVYFTSKTIKKKSWNSAFQNHQLEEDDLE